MAESTEANRPQEVVVDKLLYSLEESWTLLSLGRTKFLELVRSGEIATVRSGRRRLVSAAELTRFADSLQADREAV